MTEKSKSEEKSFLDLVSNTIQNPKWNETQDTEFVDAVKHLHDQFVLAVRQNVIMVQLFNEYGLALNSLLNPANATDHDVVSNTNSPEPGNRAERRAKDKKRTPLDL